MRLTSPVTTLVLTRPARFSAGVASRRGRQFKLADPIARAIDPNAKSLALDLEAGMGFFVAGFPKPYEFLEPIHVLLRVSRHAHGDTQDIFLPARASRLRRTRTCLIFSSNSYYLSRPAQDCAGFKNSS
jgi:hypothetical protein